MFPFNRPPAPSWPRPSPAGLITLVAALCLASAAQPQETPSSPVPQEEVDLELVIAVDISMSMDIDEQEVQRAGYVAAFRDSGVIDAIETGLHGRIAVAYLEWAGIRDQRVTVDWRLVEDRETAEAFAAELEGRPFWRARRTSISQALLTAAELFEDSGYRGLRRVVDMSGDGANNQGLVVTDARAHVLARGITINGLPLMLKDPDPYSDFELVDLDLYYEDCVIGGPGAFMVPVRSVEAFPGAIRSKLILEIAGLVPQTRDSPVRPAQAGERPNCLSGEFQWRGWMRDGYQ